MIYIGDPKDKSVVGKAIQVANTLAPLSQNGIAQLIESTAGASIRPASQILEALRFDYLKQDQNNKVLWTSKAPNGSDIDLTFVTGNR